MTDLDSDYQRGDARGRRSCLTATRRPTSGSAWRPSARPSTPRSAAPRVARFKDKGRRYDIRVRLLASQRQRPQDIDRLLVRSQNGGLVRLGDLVHIEQQPSLQAITRQRPGARHHDLRKPGARGFPGRSDSRPRSMAAQQILPPRLSGHRRRERARPSRSRSNRSASPSSWASSLPTWSSRASSTRSPIRSPFSSRCRSASRGALLALWIVGQSPQHLQLPRPHPAHGDRRRRTPSCSWTSPIRSGRAGSSGTRRFSRPVPSACAPSS